MSRCLSPTITIQYVLKMWLSHVKKINFSVHIFKNFSFKISIINRCVYLPTNWSPSAFEFCFFFPEFKMILRWIQTKNIWEHYWQKILKTSMLWWCKTSWKNFRVCVVFTKLFKVSDYPRAALLPLLTSKYFHSEINKQTPVIITIEKQQGTVKYIFNGAI